ncbi:MAG TPA: magnesium transporter CorA family protein [Rhizomicrobium sp.]|nr:magnesium transporter CorA family protein [Rhizomicrobium sp.]
MLQGSAARPVTLRLFLFWMAYQGFFLALPQVVVGAFNSAHDVGMAMEYLLLSAGEKQTAPHSTGTFCLTRVRAVPDRREGVTYLHRPAHDPAAGFEGDARMMTTYPAGSPADGAVWIDLFEPGEDERSKASAICGVEVPSRGALEEIEASSRLRAMGDALILSMPIASKSASGDAIPTPLGFVLTPKLLVTVRYAELHAIKPALGHLQANGRSSSVEMFALLVEAMVDYSADLLEQLSAKLNGISLRVFRRSAQESRRNVARSNRALKETLLEIGETGHRLSYIRDSILGLQRIAPFAAENAKGWLGEPVQARLKIVGQDLQSLADFEVHLTDKMQFLLDAVLGFINTEQNDIFKVLTIVSVVGIPPTLIASMYGMNFDTIQEYHWRYGYEWGLSLIVLSAVLPTAWFKWRGWW